jgi:(p)ppGpp synthase/HD superfamily hydrolase
MSIIAKALKFATERHSGQFRKFDSKPYVTHPKEVTFILLEIMDDADTEILAAAILHDTVEDTYDNIEEGLNDVGKLFGQRVMGLVDELTTRKEDVKRHGKKKCLTAKMNAMTNDAFLIKLADRYHNIEGLLNANVPKDFIRWYWKETVYIIDNLDREFTKEHDLLLGNINAILEHIKTETLK